jgi:hypothetical protein
MTRDYFIRFDDLILTENARSNLAKICCSVESKFSKTRKEDNLDSINFAEKTNIQLLEMIPEVRETMKRICVPCVAVVIRHLPDAENRPHKDNIRRGCAIAVPIIPFDEFASTVFWTDKNVYAGEVDYSNRKPALLNLQKFHSVKNNNNVRLNFQLSFTQSYEVIRNLAESGKLIQ